MSLILFGTATVRRFHTTIFPSWCPNSSLKSTECKNDNLFNRQKYIVLKPLQTCCTLFGITENTYVNMMCINTKIKTSHPSQNFIKICQQIEFVKLPYPLMIKILFKNSRIHIMNWITTRIESAAVAIHPIIPPLQKFHQNSLNTFWGITQTERQTQQRQKHNILAGCNK